MINLFNDVAAFFSGLNHVTFRFGHFDSSKLHRQEYRFGWLRIENIIISFLIEIRRQPLQWYRTCHVRSLLSLLVYGRIPVYALGETDAIKNADSVIKIILRRLGFHKKEILLVVCLSTLYSHCYWCISAL